ncbi:MAG: flagellar motor switch protein FliM [Paracoccaceae bacterium]|jgi:flagellar motor switch protein FliM
MADAAPQSVLRRKAVSSLRGQVSVMTPEKAMAEAVARASQDAFGLAMHLSGCKLAMNSLSELLDMLPEKCLLAVVEGPGDAQGLLALDPMLFAGLVEFQTIGRINPVLPAARRATRTDAILVADWIDRLLHEFDVGLSEVPDSQWAQGYSYCSAIPDARPLALLLEDAPYRLLEIDVSIGEDVRAGRAILAVLADGSRPGVRRKANGSGKRSGAAQGDPRKPMTEPEIQSPKNAKWAADLAEVVAEADVEVRAILYRLEMPISDLGALKIGDLVNVPLASVGNVRIEGSDGRLAGHGRLGQSMGQRAIRINGADVTAQQQARRSFRDASGSGPHGTASAEKDLMETVGPMEEEDEGGIDNLMSLDTGVPEMNMPDLSDLGSIQDIGDLPDILGAGDGDDISDFGDLSAMPDIPDMADLGALLDLPDIPDFPDLPDLGGA